MVPPERTTLRERCCLNLPLTLKIQPTTIMSAITWTSKVGHKRIISKTTIMATLTTNTLAANAQDPPNP